MVASIHDVSNDWAPSIPSENHVVILSKILPLSPPSGDK